ncbi:hypothetical protein FACS1894110_17840 [Spirochaetia bacterium]|nr:hypothetical protein FACS1894110_17840 [Spirochaetia bacterium]
MSDFGTATLDLRGKADFRPLFQEPVPKLTEFWNRLIHHNALCVYFFLMTAVIYGQTKIDISGTVEWDRMEINAAVSLDLASANIRLPTGRTQGEELIGAEYIALIRPHILSIPVDSSLTIEDYIEAGNFSLLRAEGLALSARAVPPSLSPDFTKLKAQYTISIAGISAEFIRHTRPAETRRVLIPAPTTSYTGIIIMAAEELPVHGMKALSLTLPCLFPKIWDTDMNLIYERNMLEVQNPRSPMVRYAAAEGIFRPTPSGLSPELSALVGDKPLRIIARGVFGKRPTDPIIDREDALTIISSEENRRLLREGKVVIVLNDEVLQDEF